MSTLSREVKNCVVVMSSEESSSYPDDDSELELGLGLSLGGGKAKAAPPPAGGGGVGCDHQVVGWPPVRTYRMNSLANQAKSPVTEDFFSTFDECKSKNVALDKNNYAGNRTNNTTNEKGFQKKSLFVKVNMDGIPIGRKVDLNAHTCYKSLARALDDMFRTNVAVGARRSNVEEQIVVAATRQPGRLLDGSSEFVLTYEDKDGDWMLVGDVPWEMFLSSVRRLRIMKKAEANGLAPKIS
ncbi:hypothetical protein BUALT_Bualt02G0199100 [Buddleja alternifolia]|uniref:Auxin-responsive protein n=1 Tax=Buddleja alternifolia TaxID=168488 RepID=A0AAV6Y8U0_9LAMI|nr:hypothetical protein BUALT_Bualt02G0199100 [Buddleja alternifolia]